jgi:hypothetical protein
VTDKEQLEQEACDNGIAIDYINFKIGGANAWVTILMKI